MSYFDRLQQDYDLFTFPVPHPQSIIPNMQPKDVKSYSDLHALMSNIAAGVEGAYYQSPHLIDAHPESLGLQTKLARHVVDMCRLDRTSKLPTHICPDGERRLAVSMQPERIADPKKDSPVIVERDGQPVGIMKQLGDPNYFALEDDPATVTHAGHFYRTGLEHTYYRPFIKEERDDPALGMYKMRAGHAFSVSIDEAGELIRPGMQFSIFMTPVKARKKLSYHSMNELREQASKLALRTSLQDLREIARQALISAEPAHIGYKYHPRQIPEGWQEVRIDGKYQLKRCSS